MSQAEFKMWKSRAEDAEEFIWALLNNESFAAWLRTLKPGSTIYKQLVKISEKRSANTKKNYQAVDNEQRN